MWVQSKDNLADVMTKRTASSDVLHGETKTVFFCPFIYERVRTGTDRKNGTEMFTGTAGHGIPFPSRKQISVAVYMYMCIICMYMYVYVCICI